MAMYATCDLYATNSYLAIIDGEGLPVFKGKLRNEWEILRSAGRSVNFPYGKS